MDNQPCSNFAQIFFMGLGMSGQLTGDNTAANYSWLQLHIAKYSIKVKMTMQRATFKNSFKYSHPFCQGNTCISFALTAGISNKQCMQGKVTLQLDC